ncbi:MAG: Na+/H+ antiporter NhaA [Bacteroidales bacterium]|nr:Na+/H+ antiporter NhaA [Bacteroidales bacterium]
MKSGRVNAGVLDTIFSPFDRFLKIEASGGILLLVSTGLAIFWANSHWADSYHHFWENMLSIEVGSFLLTMNFHHWINDGLMAIFFFFVGLEIKRELVAGELSSLKQASLPIAAAIGGMLIPALIYISVNENPAADSGWGIPMATDIAFSLGVLSLLGKKVPTSLKVFLVALAIVDDLGAVLVIALFYTGDIQGTFLLTGLALFLFLLAFNFGGIRYIPAYMIVGWVIWYLFYRSGIHPTIAGVLIAFAIPVKRKIAMHTFKKRMDKNLEVFCIDGSNEKITLSGNQLIALDNMEEEIYHVQSPVQNLEHTLHHFVTFFIMPIFALANAGVELGNVSPGGLLTGLSGNIELSLILGKVLGILLFTWLAVRLGIGSLPGIITWKHILGLGFLGGMGFTMSLFISNLAFVNEGMLVQAKIGILMGSLLAGILGYVLLWFSLREPKRE